MTAPNAVAIKNAIITALQTQIPATITDMSAAAIQYSYTSKTAEASNRKWVYWDDDVTGSLSVMAMAGGARIKRLESATCQLAIQVVRMDPAAAYDADTACMAIGAVVENYLAANWQQAGAATALVTGYRLGRQDTDDRVSSLLVYTITMETHLT